MHRPAVRRTVSIEGERPGTASFAWMTHDLSKSGVLGDATLATAAMGIKLLDSLGQGWAGLIRDIHLFKQPAAGAGPLGS